MVDLIRPTAPPKVFVSYSSQDGVHPYLFARLREQAVKVWDCELRDEGIAPGERIEVACLRQIRESDLVVAILSESALASSWVRLELEEAIELAQRDALKLLPVVEQSTGSIDTLTPPFTEVMRLRGINVRRDSIGRLEEAVLEITAALGVPYAAPSAESARLPFLAQFHRELEGAIPDRGYGKDVYARVVGLTVEFREHFERQEYGEALDTLDYLLQILAHEYPQQQLYYPRLVRAITLIACQQSDLAISELSLLAQRLEIEARSEGPRAIDAKSEDTLYALLGYAHYHRGEFQRARAWYERALAVSNLDASNQASLLLARIYCGDAVDLAPAFEALDGAQASAEDRIQIEFSKALALAAAGDEVQALPAFRRLEARDDCPTQLKLASIKQLVRLEEPPRARALMVATQALWLSDAEARWLWAETARRSGLRQEAIDAYRALSDAFPSEWLWQHRALQGFVELGAHADAASLAHTILCGTQLGLPGRPEHYRVTAAANAALGRKSRAEYDLERAGWSI